MTQRTTLTTAEAAFVRAQRVARLATADAEGNPHVIPVCYAFDGTRFYTPLDEKPKRVSESKLRRVRNIAAPTAVALVIDQYSDDWTQLGYLLIHGSAALIPPEDSSTHPQALLLLRARYQQYHSMALEKFPVIAITPTQVISWGPALAHFPQ